MNASHTDYSAKLRPHWGHKEPDMSTQPSIISLLRKHLRMNLLPHDEETEFQRINRNDIIIVIVTDVHWNNVMDDISMLF